ncbi:TetR/AcrR family transcriptional regulator [Nocardia mexicana]|uniref:TetR family transcriptional regulator n=1 Tax=Nocardia mexicana TaxID=279262 RepID=A0A370H6T7_9NOCA|nr:TetR/AcrR family transcriptional regulator [Nocardia mexicana]RDI52127.1 TetR family transcriptional regulator [Nocardia mexicana]
MTAPTKRSDATRQALLRAARDEFAEYGLAGARVDRIAEAAGVNKERIYGLFGSKDKLFDVILIESLDEFTDVVQPLADTEPGDYVGKLFRYHRDNPQLLRLLLWEALHRGADAHDVDGRRDELYARKFARAQEQFGVDERAAGRVLLALCGLAAWTHAVPQTTRLLLGPAADDTAATQEFLQEFARAAMRREAPVNPLITTTTESASTADAAEPVPTTNPAELRRTGTARELTPSSNAPESIPSGDAGDRTPTTREAAAPSTAATRDVVGEAAARLRAAQAEADAARAELAEALRGAHAEGAGANELARRVAGTMSRPVVLKLLAE